MEGNQMKMRETLLVVRDALDTISAHEDDIEFVRAWIAQTKDAVQEALAAPPRQCNVGTAEEQKGRFDAFCDAQPRMRYSCDCNLQKNRQGLCEGLCEFAWAQTPYAAQEGAGK